MPMIPTVARSRTPQRRLVLVLAGAVTASLGIAAALSWADLLRVYHLLRLRHQPALFHEMLSSDSPAKEAACRDFVKEPAGKEALFRAFLEEYDRCEASPPVESTDRGRLPLLLNRLLHPPTDRVAISLWKEESPAGRASYSFGCLSWRGAGSHSSFAMANQPGNEVRRRRILDLLDACAGQTLRLPYGEKEAELHMASTEAIRKAAEEAGDESAYPLRLGWDEPFWGLRSHPPPARHLCFIRILP